MGGRPEPVRVSRRAWVGRFTGPILAVLVFLVLPAGDGGLSLGGRATALMLGIAFAASIGSLGTIIGTPPNTFMAAYLAENHDINLGFGQWMPFGVPIAVVFLDRLVRDHSGLPAPDGRDPRWS